MSKSPNWTKEEIAILEEAYPRLGRCTQLQEVFPNRTLEGICLKASRLGLKVHSNIRKRRTNDEYLQLLESTNFISLEEYKGSTVLISHMCCICDHIWKARPQAVLRPGAKCPKCDLKARKTPTAVVDDTLGMQNITRVSEYTGALDPITVTHSECGHTWVTKYSYIQQGSGCPLCNKGFGYLNIKDICGTATLYLLEVITKNESFLKIGVTLQPLRRRIASIKSQLGGECISISILHSIQNSPKRILELETRLLSNPNFIRYTSKLDFAGRTELLSIENDVVKIRNEMDSNE